MTINITTLASPHLPEALEANMVAFWTTYGVPPGRRLERRPELVSVLTGIPEPLFNAVFRARLAPGAVAPAVDDLRSPPLSGTCRFFGGSPPWRRPLTWVTPCCSGALSTPVRSRGWP